MTRNRLNPPDLALRAFLLVLVVALTALAMFLLSSAMSPSRADAAIGAGDACWEDRTITELEHERNVVVQDEVTVTEYHVAKHTRERSKGKHGWGEWSEPTLWQPASHEAWVTEIPEPVWQPHHRDPKLQRDWAVLPTGAARTTVVQEQVTETETEWFASTPPDGWTQTGQARTRAIEVEVPCPEEPPAEEPPACVCLPVEGMPCDQEPGCPTLPADPCSVWPEECTVDHGPEPEADHTTPPPAEPEEVVTATPVAAEQTLPRTGVKEDIASVGLVLLFVGGSLLGVELYDRKHRGV